MLSIPGRLRVARLGRLLVSSLAIAVLSSAFGCGGGAGEDPQAVLRSYAQALEEGRADDAYRMLSDDARRGISPEAFRRMVKDDPEEVKEIGKSLQRPTTPAV